MMRLLSLALVVTLASSSGCTADPTPGATDIAEGVKRYFEGNRQLQKELFGRDASGNYVSDTKLDAAKVEFLITDTQISDCVKGGEKPGVSCVFKYSMTISAIGPDGERITAPPNPSPLVEGYFLKDGNEWQLIILRDIPR